MENVLNELHELDYVKRYSWFDPNANNEKYPKLQTADIINENNQLTTLGEFYASKTRITTSQIIIKNLVS